MNILGFKIQGLIFEQTTKSIFKFPAEYFTIQNVCINLTVCTLWPSYTLSTHRKNIPGPFQDSLLHQLYLIGADNSYV